MLDLAFSALVFQGAVTAGFVLVVALLSCLPARRDALYRAP